VGQLIEPGALAHFQDNFVRALLQADDAVTPEVTAVVAQPAFAVYRNTTIKGCIDALQANYPTVAKLVGEEWFRGAVTVYVRRALPADPTLLRYGAEFANFLSGFEPAAGLPFLAGVACLDRLWTEAHTARDEEILDPSTIADLAPETLARTVLIPHAAARWMWFADTPVYTIWSRNRIDDASDADIDWKGEGALLIRPRDVVKWMVLDAGSCAFLDICAAGGTLAIAAKAALEAHSDTDLSQLISTLLGAGAFHRTYVTCD
jgi:hypothetical protein